MKLLIVTQAVDTQEPVLGFFHEWIKELAGRFESVEVMCLKEGVHALPSNVRAHSLGKEKGRKPSFIYAMRFLSLAWKLRRSYDAVFVHMNQEYVLIAGLLWKLLGKRVYLWRNHYAGSLLTDLAAVLCTNVFYTSKSSYTARYPHAVEMPVGVDTKRFTPDESKRVPGSILFLARMAPSKRPDMLLSALEKLAAKGVAFTATFAGSPLPEHEAFYTAFKEKAAPLSQIRFVPAVTHEEAAELYREHELFVNTSPSGMLDKTIFEAAASGCIVLAPSEDWKEIAGEQSYFADTSILADKLHHFLTVPPGARNDARDLQEKAVEPHALGVLSSLLSRTLQK